jgi:hypothetical protein
LDWPDLDADAVTAFLEHLESERNNGRPVRVGQRVSTVLTAVLSYFALDMRIQGEDSD